MEYPVITYSLSRDQIEIEEKEVLRYLGYTRNGITEESIKLIQQRIPEVRAVISGKACYCRYQVRCLDRDEIELPYGRIKSRDLSRNLKDCSEVYFFAATIGLPFDRLLQTTRLKSMANAAIMQAIGATAVEFLCDSLNAKLKNEALSEGYFVRPRYSPGFGDYTLDNQRGIFSILNPSKHVGINLKDNLIMAPEKSVTALIGIGKEQSD